MPTDLPMRFLRPLLPLLSLLALTATAPARADTDLDEFITDYTVYSPYVTEGQSEVELRAAKYRDSSLVLNDLNGEVISVAHSFTGWWKTEVYLGEYTQIPRQTRTLVAHEFENTFQLTTPGEYWADMGFLASYEFKTHNGEANEIELGPLFEKRSGRFDQRLNLIWEKQIGTGAERNYEFRSNYSLTYEVRPVFAPGIEVYTRPSMNTYQAGPAVYGEWAQANGNELEYSASWVLGLNAHAPDQTLIIHLEYEFF